MKLEEIIEHIDVKVSPLKDQGHYLASVKGYTLEGEPVNLHIELIDCNTHDILTSTLRAKLEEIFECRYHYEIGDVGGDNLYHDGGTFK